MIAKMINDILKYYEQFCGSDKEKLIHIGKSVRNIPEWFVKNKELAVQNYVPPEPKIVVKKSKVPPVIAKTIHIKPKFVVKE